MTRHELEALILDCENVTPDVPIAVWNRFMERVGQLAYESLRRLAEEERQDAAMAAYLDEEEAEHGVRISGHEQ